MKRRKMTPETVRRTKELGRRIDAEEAPAIKARARASFARHERLREIVSVLKEERLRLGLTLTEVAQRAGIDKANLSRMENDQAANPTLETLQRYAEALGREVRIYLAKLPRGRRAG